MEERETTTEGPHKLGLPFEDHNRTEEVHGTTKEGPGGATLLFIVNSEGIPEKEGELIPQRVVNHRKIHPDRPRIRVEGWY